ncbi:MAG TPA: NADH-quinone oxidoreductase subunit NuoK, partial [Acidobacteriaceae bacterium]|nr:NADH-quinone oxidoreductase subunit NuoK [Acidobacteriaceae bacterium]
MTVPMVWYLILSAALFSIGICSFLIKRNIITIFLSIELMLNAVNLAFVTFANHWHQVSGQIF